MTNRPATPQSAGSQTMTTPMACGELAQRLEDAITSAKISESRIAFLKRRRSTSGEIEAERADYLAALGEVVSLTVQTIALGRANNSGDCPLCGKHPQNGTTRG